MESDAADDDQNEPLPPPPGPLTCGMPIPVPEHGGGSSDLTPCPNCSRTFNVNALRKHVVVCEKMLAKKRKVFDSSRQRREGTSLSTYVLPKNFGLPNAEKAAGLHTPPGVSRESSTVVTGSQQPQAAAAASPMTTRRKSNSDQARSTARATLRKGAGTPTAAVECPPAAAPQAAPPAAAAAPPAQSRVRSTDRSVRKRIKEVASERCPHCDRSFNAKAYDRHVEWCKEKAIQATIKPTNTSETNKAKERMEARKQYRPPNLKTKRSLNRDKYSGSNEEQYEAEMVAQKQAQMSLMSMTSSVHSDNLQRNVPPQMKVLRPVTPQTKTLITQNTVNLYMASEEANALSQERVASINPRRKQRETCQEIDVAMDRLRRTATSESLQLAKLDCMEAAPLLPVKSRRALPRQKLEAAEHLIAAPQAAITFEELNGLIKRKAGTKICNIKMDFDENDLKVSPKLRSSTALVRQARRRIRTRENPNIDLRSLEPPKALSSFDLTAKDIILASDTDNCDPLPAPLRFRQKSKNTLYSGSDDETNSLRGEIQIRLEASTVRTICRPKKRDNLPAIMNSSEPMRALPMPDMKQSLEQSKHTRLPRIEREDEPKDQYQEEGYVLDGDAEPDDMDYDEADMEVDQLLSRAKLLEHPYDNESDDAMEQLDSEEEEEEQQEAPLKLPLLRKQSSNVSRRLVLLEQDEEGTMYIKAPRSPTKRSARTPPSTECTLIHRSDSNISSSGGSFKSPPNSSGSYKTPPTSSGSYKTPMTSSDERMQRQQSNASSRVEHSQKYADESQKREIFISIDTEPNAQGRSPISPDSLRHMVGNSQTPIDVLHIENGNEPEHARFSKISDSEDHFDAELDDETSRIHYKKRLTSTASTAAKLPLPNVEANNAKNVIEKMRSEFKQLGEEVGASMRRDMMQRQGQNQQKQAQQELKDNSPLTPSPSGDSDELSSLDGYPMSSSHSSRRGASSKLSSDSAYGSSNSPYSLSRQRSGEQQQSNSAQRSQNQMRPHTASGAMGTSNKLNSAMMDASTQAQSNYGTLKARQRMFAASFGGGGGGVGDGPSECCAEYSSSSSEHSLPVAIAQQQQQQQQQNSNYNYQQQQQQTQSQAAYNNNNNSYEHTKNMNNNNNNNINNGITPTASQHSLVSNTSNGSSNMSASMKMSKFCHECGAKFIIEHAKFCMDCGVRRVVL